MRKSQIILLSAFAFVILAVAGGVIAARIIAAQIESGRYSVAAATQSAGQQVSRHPDLSGFSKIDARGDWNLTVTRGDKWDVMLSYPDDMQKHLGAHVEGDRLVLQSRRGRNGFGWFFGGHGNKVKATIVMPELTAANLADSTVFTLAGFKGDDLDIRVSGGSNIKGRDSAYKKLNLVVSGAANVDFADVVTDDAHVVLSGVGNVVLNMNGGTLSGRISGVGSLRYHGKVASQDVAVSGVSSIQPVD